MRWTQTELLATIVAGAVVATASSVNCGCGLSDFRKLVTNLSQEAEVYYPGSAQFDQLSQRWSNLETPIVNVEVLPATEKDVAEIVSLDSPSMVSMSTTQYRRC